MVHFVGAGPGSEDLITVRGMKLLQTADVIIFAGSLVNPGLLSHAKPGCEIHNSAEMTLNEVIEVIKSRPGMKIVRLHTGDPSLYGAVREQMDRLAGLGIDYDVCPGVSSFFGAAAALRAEYTLPGVTQTVIITRAAGKTPVPERESIKKLAAHGATMVLFLSAGLADKISCELIEGGYSPTTPAAVVYKATWPDERVLRGTIGELPKMMEGITKTALVVAGDFLGDNYSLSRLYSQDFETEFRKSVN